MAPRKPAPTAKPIRRDGASPCNKIAKRPARGYHKYKSGLLNVKPKGREIELVKSNQNSPLLSLPPEIRNRIWEFALGNIVFRGRTLTVPSRKRITILRPASDDTDVSVALLRCCRQIYSEAATIPLRLNTMAFDSIRQLEHAMKRLKPHQRKQITTVRLEINGLNTSRALMHFNAPRLLDTCLALRHFQVVLFNTSTDNVQVLQEREAHLRRELNSLLVQNIRLSVEGSDQQKPDPGISYIY